MSTRKILIAEPHGFCGNDKFGVRGAVRIAKKTAKQFPGRTYLLGEIVHNRHVVEELKEKYGLQTVSDLKEIPVGATVIIRAHGTPPETYEEARRRRLNIVDATCPLVAQAHKEVKRLAEEGKKILYIASNKDHDEAIGVAGEAPQAIAVTTLKELDKIEIEDEGRNTVVVTQTTLSILETEEALKGLKTKYPELTIEKHICLATTERQTAVIELAKQTGFVVIVGSPTSSNSNRLREVAESVGAKAYIVDTADELNPNWFEGVETVAVSSGASTPEWLLEEVVEKIKSI